MTIILMMQHHLCSSAPGSPAAGVRPPPLLHRLLLHLGHGRRRLEPQHCRPDRLRLDQQPPAVLHMAAGALQQGVLRQQDSCCRRENRPNRLRAGSLPGEGRGRGSPRNWSGPSGYCLDLWILVWTPGYWSGSPGYVSGPPEYWSAHLGYWSGRDPLDISLDTLDTGLDTLDTGLDTLDVGLGTLDTVPDTLNTGLNTLDTGLVGTPWISVWTPWILVWTPWILVWTPWKLVLAEGLRV